MDEYSPSQEVQSATSPPPGKPARKYKIILLEIIFIIVFILLLLVILNFFNFLRLSQIFPNQLGWLPQRDQTNSSQQQATNIENPPPDTFQYDIEYSKNTVSQYVMDTLKPEILPENLDIKQGLSFDGSIDEKRQNLFGSYIDRNNETISIVFTFIENSNLLNDFKIFIHPKTADLEDLDVDTANSLLSSYFLNPIPIDGCDSSGTTSFCKVILEETDGKREFGVIISQDSSTIYTCFAARSSTYYELVESCIAP